MDEFLKSFKAWLYERTSNPLFFIFLLCWLAWNYKLLVVSFSTGDPAIKLDLINSLLYPTPESKWCFMLIYPALTALASVSVYPFLANLSMVVIKWNQNLFAKTLLRLDQKTPVDEGVVNMLHAELISLKSENEQLEKSKNVEIASLKRTISSLNAQIPTENKIQIGAELGELDRKIMAWLGERYEQGVRNFKVGYLEELLHDFTKATKIQVEVSINHLITMGFLSKVGNDFNGYGYLLSDKGKAFVLTLSKEPN